MNSEILLESVFGDVGNSKKALITNYFKPSPDPAKSKASLLPKSSPSECIQYDIERDKKRKEFDITVLKCESRNKRRSIKAQKRKLEKLYQSVVTEEGKKKKKNRKTWSWAEKRKVFDNVALIAEEKMHHGDGPGRQRRSESRNAETTNKDGSQLSTRISGRSSDMDGEPSAFSSAADANV